MCSTHETTCGWQCSAVQRPPPTRQLATGLLHQSLRTAPEVREHPCGDTTGQMVAQANDLGINQPQVLGPWDLLGKCHTRKWTLKNQVANPVDQVCSTGDDQTCAHPEVAEIKACHNQGTQNNHPAEKDRRSPKTQLTAHHGPLVPL